MHYDGEMIRGRTVRGGAFILRQYRRLVQGLGGNAKCKNYEQHHGSSIDRSEHAAHPDP
jgi:hypothetical protein